MKLFHVSTRLKIIETQAHWLTLAVSYIKRHILEVEVILGLYILLLLLHTLPYFNVYMDENIIAFILLAVSGQLFHIPKHTFMIITLSLFSVCFVLLLRNERAAAEGVGNLIYFLLWYVCIWQAKDLWTDLKKHS